MDGGVLFQGVVQRWVVCGGGGGSFLVVGWRGGGGVVWSLFSLSHMFFIMSTLVWYYMGRGGVCVWIGVGVGGGGGS